MSEIRSDLLWQIRTQARLLVGQIASPLPEGEDFGIYDLMMSSLPNLVAHFRKLGVPAELNRMAFEPRVLETLARPVTPDIPVSFVGNLSPAHGARVRLIEHLCEALDIGIWGGGADSLPAESPIQACHRGAAWGRDMYSVLARSRITVNSHIDMAEDHANNMRLYEATGSGTLLLTDWKSDLVEIFEPGREVAVYRSPEECVERIYYYLNHEEERAAIARAGQQRTLREHTYRRRMEELSSLVARYLETGMGNQETKSPLRR